MNAVTCLVFIYFIHYCICQKCPRCGEVLKADPKHDECYLQCKDGKGRWRHCSEGKVFVEKEQRCKKKRSNQKSESKSISSRSTQKSSSRSSGRPQVNDNARIVGSAYENMDYHW